MKQFYLESALIKALQFLSTNQLSTGEFQTFISNDPLMRVNTSYDSSPFATSIVLYGLRYAQNITNIKTSEGEQLSGTAGRMRGLGHSFLLSEMEHPGVWRYWTSQSGKQIVPDLDDTCCISFLLREAGAGAVLRANRSVILQNKNHEGLFYTWITNQLNNDIDSVVNANVLLYLGSCSETAELTEYLIQTVLQDKEDKTYWYYLDNLSLYYAISRAYWHGVISLEPLRDRMVEKVLARVQQDGSFGDEQKTALAVSTLLNLKYWNDKIYDNALDYLLSTQQSQGSWRRIAYYTGPEPPAPHSAWFGSEELTTGLCIEVLSRLLG